MSARLAVKRLEHKVVRPLVRQAPDAQSVAPEPTEGRDPKQAQMVALLADPRLLMSTPNPIRAALWLVLLRPASEVLAAKSPSSHPLLAFAEALVRAALNGRLRAFVEIANRIEGRVANEFETQPVDDAPAAAARRMMIEMVAAALKKTGRV
jgi:hypothetical protein